MCPFASGSGFLSKMMQAGESALMLTPPTYFGSTPAFFIDSLRQVATESQYIIGSCSALVPLVPTSHPAR